MLTELHFVFSPGPYPSVIAREFWEDKESFHGCDSNCLKRAIFDLVDISHCRDGFGVLDPVVFYSDPSRCQHSTPTNAPLRQSQVLPLVSGTNPNLCIRTL